MPTLIERFPREYAQYRLSGSTTTNGFRAYLERKGKIEKKKPPPKVPRPVTHREFVPSHGHTRVIIEEEHRMHWPSAFDVSETQFESTPTFIRERRWTRRASIPQNTVQTQQIVFPPTAA